MATERRVWSIPAVSHRLLPLDFHNVGKRGVLSPGSRFSLYVYPATQLSMEYHEVSGFHEALIRLSVNLCGRNRSQQERIIHGPATFLSNRDFHLPQNGQAIQRACIHAYTCLQSVLLRTV